MNGAGVDAPAVREGGKFIPVLVVPIAVPSDGTIDFGPAATAFVGSRRMDNGVGSPVRAKVAAMLIFAHKPLMY